jgi:hypothetical protein
VGERLAGGEIFRAQIHHRVSSGTLQRQATNRPTAKPLDADAEAIVAAAQDTKQDLKTRAVALVNSILSKYYGGSGSKISGVTYDDAKAAGGLQVQTNLDSKAKTYSGQIFVGSSFINEIIQEKSNFGNLVAKVGHELEHVDQHNQGLVGPSHANEREFLAHGHEALFTEFPGIGRLSHTSRARHIDAAIGLYYCLDAALQQKQDYASLLQQLLARRPAEIRYGHKDQFPNPPTSCTQPSQFGFTQSSSTSGTGSGKSSLNESDEDDASSGATAVASSDADATEVDTTATSSSDQISSDVV